jgi:hypothetical protein
MMGKMPLAARVQQTGIFLCILPSYNAGAFHIGPYAKLLRYGTLATSSCDQHFCNPFD